MSHLAQGYATKKAYECYVAYTAIKQHFTSKGYDYFKYNGRVRTSYDSFVKRRDIYYFAKLSKEQDNINKILANVLVNPSVWIRDIVENDDVYLAWKKRTDSLTYIFTSDLGKLKEPYSDNFAVQNSSSYPYLIELYNQKVITPETAAILIAMSNTTDYWKSTVGDAVVFPGILFKLERYHDFLQYDKNKFRALIKDRFF